MTRRTALQTIAAGAVRPVRASDDYVSLFNGRDLDRWEGNEQVWKVENGLLTGTSDGKIASALVLGGRDYGDFELLFELRVKKGAAVVLMRGPAGCRVEGPPPVRPLEHLWMARRHRGLNRQTRRVGYLSDCLKWREIRRFP